MDIVFYSFSFARCTVLFTRGELVPWTVDEERSLLNIIGTGLKGIIGKVVGEGGGENEDPWG